MAFSIGKLGYTRRMSLLGLITGIMSGFAALVVYYSLGLTQQLFMGDLLGYNVPAAFGEGGTTSFIFHVSKYYLIPVSIVLGALVAGIIVYKFAPETEGHGTDAVISAFHNRQGFFRKRVWVVKLVASALTIGSGGSAGREGPAAQVSAGIMSVVSRNLKISNDEKRLLGTVALGSAIGAIFRSPFAGALMSAEILYRHDMEVDAIFPSLIASAVAFVIFGAVAGYSPIFGMLSYTFSPQDMLTFALLGVVCGVMAKVYVRVFYKIHDLMESVRIKKMFKPALGAVFTAAIALAFPEIMGVGYGWAQFMISGNLNAFNTYGIPLVLFFFILALAKIAATATTVGSGGSGGVFAPGMFIGACVGIFVALLLNALIPGSVPPPYLGAFAIVGMLSFFGAASKVPVSVSLMVTEMTGSLTLLPGAMFGIAAAYLASGESTIYGSQVDTRKDSPAHIGDYFNRELRHKKIRKSLLINIDRTHT